jgi:hypothetical protein
MIRRKAAEDMERERMEEEHRRARAREAVLASKRANDYLHVRLGSVGLGPRGGATDAVAAV